MATYRLMRGSELKGTMTLERHVDGTLWSMGKPSCPLIDGQAPESVALGKAKMVELINARDFAAIPAACFAHEGLNPSGLEVKSYDDIRAEAQAARTPAQRERDRIEGLFAQARRRADAEDDNNVTDSLRLESQARAALAKWREDYPVEARAEDADKLEAEADHEDDIADGALTYDADGSLSEADQQRRHDEHKTKAAELRAKAATLRA